MAARIDTGARNHKVHRSVLIDGVLCLSAHRVIVGAHGELIRLPRILRCTVYRVARRTAEDGGKTSVNIVVDGEPAEVAQGRIDVHRARKVVNNSAFGDARTAYHPRGTGGALAEDVDAAADGITEHGNPVIRVQVDEVLILVKMLLQIGEQQPKRAIRLPHLLQILLLIDAEIGQTDTRHI